MQPSRGLRRSRGTIIHNLPGGLRIRESAGSIELLSDPRDEALDRLVTIAKKRFGPCRVTLAGRGDVKRRLLRAAVEQGLTTARERQR